jgi:hypothetical protein
MVLHVDNHQIERDRFQPTPGLPDFQTKYPNLGKFWRALERKMLVYFMYGHLVYITAIW